MINYLRVLLIIAIWFSACRTIKIPKDAIISSPQEIIELELPSNLGQGYQWSLIDTSKFAVAEHTSSSNPNPKISTDLEKFKLRSKSKKGVFHLIFYSLRPFDPLTDTINAVKIYKTIVLK
ncbi:hypothetical protein [Pedobacter sp. UBA5917]|jgi:hypothetical protein|uniref:hypothetical protein n=1 Tax=Pedobacter sp. UBA5917 TaxID=1947061 RepID=UPI0025EF3D6F|nr:hypothetical protein [Pedobacter sp. UBA5917]